MRDEDGRPLGRRTFCGLLAAGGGLAAGACALGGCGGTSAAASDGGGCTLCGPPSGFLVGMPQFFMDALGNPFYVIRDAGGIYALTAVCTHQGCTVNVNGSVGFACPCHFSMYDENGNVTAGPAVNPLVHYFVSLESGQVCVDTTTNVPASTRLTPSDAGVSVG